MSIASISFILFFLGTILLYYLVPKRFQWYVLLVFSLVFYLQSGLGNIFFIIITSTTVYFSGIMLSKMDIRYANESRGDDRQIKKEKRLHRDKRKKRVLVIVLIANFGILFFFKYADYFINLLNRFLPQSNFDTLGLLLPLGISFYTFQAISYVIDVYRGTVEAEISYPQLLLFLIYFPQIIQGPIGRYNDLKPQLVEDHLFDWQEFKFGVQLTIWGYFKKLVIADGLARIVNPIINDIDTYQGFYIFTAILIYSVQIYCDFSGGIDIVSGFSQAMGIKLAVNFERPFFATSLAEFWQRWHMTLGQWMRDYVFYSIALSSRFTRFTRWLKQKNKLKLAKLLPSSIASLIVFLFVGAWHGSSFKYIAFGLYNGAIITTSLFLEDKYPNWLEKFHIRKESFSWHFFRILRTVLICTIGRYFTRANSFRHAINMFKATFSEFNPWIFTDDSFLQFGLSWKQIAVISFSLLLLLLISIMQERGVKIREAVSSQNLIFRLSIQMALIFFILLFGFYGSDVDSSTFIYQGF